MLGVSLSTLYVLFTLNSKGYAFRIMKTIRTKVSLKTIVIVLAAVLYLGSQLAHAGHFHLASDDLSAAECHLCSVTATTAINSYSFSFYISANAFSQDTSIYFAPHYGVEVSAHGSRAPPSFRYYII